MLACSLSVVAGAQPSEPTAEDKETARRLFAEGNAHFAGGRFDEALKVYTAADVIMGVPSTGLKVGKTLAALGKLVTAGEKFLAVKRLPVRPDESGVMTRAREEAGEFATEVRARIPTLHVKVTGVAPGVRVRIRIDGRELRHELSAIAQSLDPGEHEVIVSAPGFLEVKRTVSLQERQNEVVVLELRAVLPKPQVTPGRRRKISPLVWAGFAVGVAGFLVGGLTGVMSLSAAGRLDDTCDQTNNVCPASSQGDLDTAETLAPISTASFVLGSLGMAVGVVGLFLTFRSDANEPTSDLKKPLLIEPVVGLTGIGVRGTF